MTLQSVYVLITLQRVSGYSGCAGTCTKYCDAAVEDARVGVAMNRTVLLPALFSQVRYNDNVVATTLHAVNSTVWFQL